MEAYLMLRPLMEERQVAEHHTMQFYMPAYILHHTTALVE